MRRGLTVFLVVLSMLAALPARADEVASAITNARGSALGIDGTVDGFAQSAAQRIAGSQSLVHSNLGPLLGTCTAVGEVIGFGSDVATVMKAFAASSAHWSIITQSKWNAMGTGVAVDANGILWISVVFCTLANAPPPPAPAPPPTPAPAPAPAPTPPATSAPAPQSPKPQFQPPPVLRIIGPFITSDGTVSMLLGASPFLPEEDWRRFHFPSIN